MKTKEELNTLKEEVETLNKKLAELSEDELLQVTGGFIGGLDRERAGQNLRETNEAMKIFVQNKPKFNGGQLPAITNKLENEVCGEGTTPYRDDKGHIHFC